MLLCSMKKAAVLSPVLTSKSDVRDTLAAIRKGMKRASKDPAYGRELLLATGMYTKSGKIKKQFR